MSISNIIDPATGVIYAEVLPNPYPHANGLGATLAVNNSAFIPNTTTKQDATDFDTLGCVKIETGTVGQGNNLALVVGEPGDNLQIKGATLLGSLLVGNGLNTEGLPVGANGLVLKANSNALNGLGVEWGTDASGGTVMAVNAGTNISVSGTIAQPIVNLATPLSSTLGMGSVALTDKNGSSGTAGQLLSAGTGGETLWVNPGVSSVSSGTNINVDNTNPLAPIVNFATPTTSNIEIGVGTEILATSGFTTMSIDSTGLNDTYLNGLVENKEDIAVSATNVIQTISATDGSTYQNSSIVNCGSSTISDQKLATNLTTTQEGSAGITCGSTLVSMGAGCGFPSGANGSVGLQATSTNPLISLSQSAPFSASYSTIIDKDGITQNNSGGVGFNIQTNSSDFNIYNTANVSILPNNNTTIASVGTTFLNGNLIKCVKTGAGGQANPQLILENTNATGSVALEVYKNKPTASIGGDVLFNQSVYGKDGANNKQEYTRISHTVRDNTSGGEDGSMEMSCFVNGSVNTFLQLNGIENEVNCLKNLDMTGKNIITNTGDMTISTATSASGIGRLTLQSKEKLIVSAEATHELELNANSYSFTTASALSPSSGGNSGQHLAITINGVAYKIKLELP